MRAAAPAAPGAARRVGGPVGKSPTVALPLTYHGSLYEPRRYPDVKDPSPVFDGTRWHLFGTGCVPGGCEILHSTAPALSGPWREERPPAFYGVDRIRSRCAPGVVAEGRRLHLFLQHEFNVLGGQIEHLVSDDGGRTFRRARTALRSKARGGEAGIYDADAAEIAGQRYLSYAAMSVVGQPDLYLARSRTGSWDGPWERLGCILDHGRVPCHNQLGTEDYEWGLEGPQLLEIPGGGVLLTAVCFLPDRPAGHRQRLLLAVAEEATGPYVVLGAAVEPSHPGGAGENGHGTAVLREDGLVHLIYQERAGEGMPWRILRATTEQAAVRAALSDARAGQVRTANAADMASLGMPA
jgi:hypothetical protein